MIKLTIEDFLFEVKEEMLCYEDLGEKKAEIWGKEFIMWLNNDKIKKSNVIVKGDKKYFCLDDESEIFDIVDEYLDAIEKNKESEYWSKFQ